MTNCQDLASDPRWPDDHAALRVALDILNRIKSGATDEVGMFSNDHMIDCCNRGIDAIIDLLDESIAVYTERGVAGDES